MRVTMSRYNRSNGSARARNTRPHVYGQTGGSVSGPVCGVRRQGFLFLGRSAEHRCSHLIHGHVRAQIPIVDCRAEFVF